MDTPPAARSPVPMTLRKISDGLMALYRFARGDTVATFGPDGWAELGDAHEAPMLRQLVPHFISMDHGASPVYMPLPSALPNILLRRHPVIASLANCRVDRMDLIATRDIAPCSPLVLELSPGTVLGQDIPVVIKAACEVVTQDFLLGTVPADSGGGTDVTLIDGYITMESMARLVCMEHHCHACAVIGGGYGEIGALMAVSRQCPVLMFEKVQIRREVAHQLITHLGLGGSVTHHECLEEFNGPWPACPTLMWCNNLRYNDGNFSPPAVLLSAQQFPFDGSTLIAMVPFSGEINLHMCSCGKCMSGSSYTATTSTLYIPSTPIERCGIFRGFVGGGRLIFRSDLNSPVYLEPYAAGAGRYPATRYSLTRCGERHPTPEADLVYTTEVMRSIDDLTPPLASALKFASDWLGGDLKDESMIFHGSIDNQGSEELLGIDCAVAFIVEEPGASPVVYGYRTLGLVRDCGVDGIIRINQDIMRLQGKSFINQSNLQLAHVIRTCFPQVTGVVIEPDSHVDYHKNYEKGFYWKIDETLPPRKLIDVIPRRSYKRYRAQVQLDPERYESYYFAVPPPKKRRAVQMQ